MFGRTNGLGPVRYMKARKHILLGRINSFGILSFKVIQLLHNSMTTKKSAYSIIKGLAKEFLKVGMVVFGWIEVNNVVM